MNHGSNNPPKAKLKRITDCRDDIQKKLKTSAIHEKIFFYIILEENGKPHQLHAGDVEKIHNRDPEKADVIIEPHPSLPAFQYCGWNQVWVNVDDEKKLLEEDSAANVSDVLKHKTDLLEIVYKAIEKFWLNHDLNQPPKADEVIEWICTQKADGKNVAVRNALVIDTIIRPTPFKLGGNRSRKPKKG